MSRPLALMTVGLLATALAGCADDSPAPSAASTSGRYDGDGRLVEGRMRNVARPNVVLICLDTVRADAVEARGDAPPVMPALAAFCKDNTRFVDASAPASWTMPCVTTTLCGLSPEHHGVQGNGRADAVVRSVAMLAEYLKGAGYATTALTGGGWILEQFGFAQGFDQFTRYDALTIEDGGKRLDEFVSTVDRTKPWFLFVHSYEAHDPYGPKRPPVGADDPAKVAEVNAYVDRFRAGLAKASTGELPDGIDGGDLLVRWRAEPITFFALSSPRVGREVVERVAHRWAETVLPTDPRRATIETTLHKAYDGGLQRVDEGFRRLLDRLKPVTPPASTVVIVTTDHGEAFGEHGTLGHGRFLYDELTRVLMAIKAPGRVPAGAIHGSVTLADVVPTVLDLCELPEAKGLDGVSLVALASGKAPGRPTEAEEFHERWDGPTQIPVRAFSVRDDRFKFIATLDTSTGVHVAELFDLSTDPSEKRPLPVAALDARGEPFRAAVARVLARVKAAADGAKGK